MTEVLERAQAVRKEVAKSMLGEQMLPRLPQENISRVLWQEAWDEADLFGAAPSLYLNGFSWWTFHIVGKIAP